MACPQNARVQTGIFSAGNSSCCARERPKVEFMLFEETTIEKITDGRPDVIARAGAAGSREKYAMVRETPPAEGRIRVNGRGFSRDGKPHPVQGVTYGPFAPDADGNPLPPPERIRQDFAQMRRIGVNSVRIYHIPPAWFLDLGASEGISVLMDVSWPKDVCFLESAAYQKQARQAVRAAAERGRGHSGVFAYSLGNEIPADIARWHGANKIQRFLSELQDVAKQTDPDCLTTYANYPSTEYLDLPFLDFAAFNVYLHDVEAFQRYLLRLMNRIGDRPLLLGELGMDTLRHSETKQAELLGGHLRQAALLGVAGAYVFSWTDDWHTHGYQIEDWAFGLTTTEREPKPSYYAVGEVFGQPPSRLLTKAPPVSVVVCSYNGGRTLAQCLESLRKIDYPDYEVILVDDGSTDDTPEIATRFPEVKTIRQQNQGLSAARNVGMQAASGAIIVYTDSDCFAHPNWLTHLVYQLERCGAVGVGGPNLTPDDGWLAACVAAAPGQPTHVLESDQIAEHIPGCNMAFYKWALEEINGFDPIYRAAGDDVNICWRLQQAGHWITFAPGAFVWHHRRHNVRAYFKQQRGYGEAEAILSFEHPERFNLRGESMWNGRMYGGSLPGLQIGKPIIYHGVWGAGLFQTLYQPATSYWPLLPITLEWRLLMLLVALTATAFRPAWFLVAAMVVASAGVSVARAIQAPLPKRYDGLRSRLLIAYLCHIQPIVRSMRRYRRRLAPTHFKKSAPEISGPSDLRLPLSGRKTLLYWDGRWHDRSRIDLLAKLQSELDGTRWAILEHDNGWADWDFAVRCHPWTWLSVTTVREPGGQIRLRYRMAFTELTKIAFVLSVVFGLFARQIHALVPAVIAAALGGIFLHGWIKGRQLAGNVMRFAESALDAAEVIRIHPKPERDA